MITKINNHSPEYLTLNTFSHNPKSKNGYLSYRYHQTRESERKEATRALIGSAIGTLIPLFLFAKKQNTSMLKLQYGLKEITGVSAGSIIGGVLGGRIDNDRFDRIQKVKEGVFQFTNAALPPAIAVALKAITQKCKPLNNSYGRIASAVIGLTGGMALAAKLSNFICDPNDKEPDRKLTFKDSLANIDDAIGIFAMSDCPALQKIAGPILPLIYMFCGYRAGESN